jgi:hypothetical protein
MDMQQTRRNPWLKILETVSYALSFTSSGGDGLGRLALDVKWLETEFKAGEPPVRLRHCPLEPRLCWYDFTSMRSSNPSRHELSVVWDLTGHRHVLHDAARDPFTHHFTHILETKLPIKSGQPQGSKQQTHFGILPAHGNHPNHTQRMHLTQDICTSYNHIQKTSQETRRRKQSDKSTPVGHEATQGKRSNPAQQTKQQTRWPSRSGGEPDSSPNRQNK